MQFNFNEEAKKHEQEAGIGGDTFKFKEGMNPIRVVSPSVKHVSSFKGNINTKFLTYVIDRADGNIKLAFLPYTIIKMIGDLQANPDYSFDSVPMPYDITVTATKAGTKEVNYTVTPARNNTGLTQSEVDAIKELKSLHDIRKKLDDKQKINITETAKDEYTLPTIEQEPSVDETIENIPF